MIIKIKLIYPDGKIVTENFFRKKIEVGRYSDNDLVIENATVSGNHCEIIQENDSLKILDKGSRNGVIFNEALVSEARIDKLGILKLGDCILEVELDQEDRTREIDLAQFNDGRKQKNKTVFVLGGCYIFLTSLKFWLGNYHSSQLKVFNELLMELVGFLMIYTIFILFSKLASRKMNLMAILNLLIRTILFSSILYIGMDFMLSIHPWFSWIQLVLAIYLIHCLTRYIQILNSHLQYKKVITYVTTFVLVIFSSIKLVEKINSHSDFYFKSYAFDQHFSFFVPYIAIVDSNLSEFNTGLAKAAKDVDQYRLEYQEKKKSHQQ